MSSRPPLIASTLTLLALLLSLLSDVGLRVAGQTYQPAPPPQLSCPPGQVFVQLGNSSTLAYANHAEGQTSASSNVWMNLFNATQYGTSIYQMQLGLLDNSALQQPAHLRFGVYSVTGTSYTLLGASGEVTVYPYSDQVVYANLLTPVPLTLGGEYALGYWSDTTIYTATSTANGYGYASGMTGPGSIAAAFTYTCPTCALTSRPLAATGCAATSTVFGSPNQLYTFCAYLEQSTQPSTPPIKYTDPGVYTSLVEYQGVAAVSASASSNSFGSFQQVLGLLGTASTVNSPQSYAPSSPIPPAPTSATFVLGSSASASNLLYTSASTSLVDSSGLSLSLSTNVTLTLQFNASTGQLQTIDPINGQVTGAVTGYQLLPYTAADAPCTPSLVAPVSAVPFTCPAGSAQVVYGDSSRVTLYSGYALETAFLLGSVLYTRAFTVRTNGTTLYQVSMLVFQNPGRIVHLRMGIYAAVNITNAAQSTTAATMALLAQTAQYTLINSADGVLTLNLLTPVALNASTTYYIGYWADSYLYTGYSYYFIFPSYFAPYSNASLPQVWSSGGNGEANVPQASAIGCVANSAPSTFTLCAQFVESTGTLVTYTGTLSAIPLSGSVGVYEVVSGSGNVSTITMATGVLASNYSWTVGAFSAANSNLLYTAASGSASYVDSLGLSLVFANALNSAVTQSVIRFSPSTSTYTETQVSYTYSNTPATLTNRASAVYLAAGSTPPSCPVPNIPPAALPNTIAPVSVSKVLCSGTSVVTTFGDSLSGDYTAHAEGSGVQGNVVYTNSFTAAANLTLSQVSLSVLANSASVLTLRMGVYSSSGALLAQTAEYLLNGVLDESVNANLLTPVTTVAGLYYLALWANGSLNIATGANSTSAMASAYSHSGLPTSFTASTAGPSIAMSISGCGSQVVATHSVCGVFQYYYPSVGSAAPYSTSLVYTALLQAGPSVSTSFGSGVQAVLGSGHLTSYVGGYAATLPAISSYSLALKPAGPGTQLLYPTGAAAGVDATGLSFVASNLTQSVSVTLSYNASVANGLAETFLGLGSGSLISSYFAVSAYNATLGLPSCTAAELLQHNSTASAAIQACPIGTSAISYGDDREADLTNAVEYVSAENAMANDIYLRSFSSSANASTTIYELGFGMLQNFNTYVHVQLALYDAAYNFLVAANEVVVQNSLDQTIIAQLTSPYTLQPNTSYNIALWVDTTIFNAYTLNGAMIQQVPYSTNGWPRLFVSAGTANLRAVQAFGCATLTPPLCPACNCSAPTTTSPTAPTSTSTSATTTGSIGSSTANSAGQAGSPASSAVSSATRSALSSATSSPLSSASSAAAAVSSAATAATAASATSGFIPSSLPQVSFFSSSAALSSPSSAAVAVAVSSASPAVTSAAAPAPACPTAAPLASSTASPLATSAAAPPGSATGSSAIGSSTAPAGPSSCPSLSCSSSDSSLSKGAIAGIVVGCSIGSLLVGLMLAWCCLVGAGAGGGKALKQGQPRPSDEVSGLGGNTQSAANVELSQLSRPGQLSTA